MKNCIFGFPYSRKKIHPEAEFLFWEKNYPFMTNNTNLRKRVKNQNHTCTIHRNTTIHVYLNANAKK
jgi:hypothetical protein